MKRFLHRLTYLLCLGIVTFVLICACSQSSYQDAISPASSAENCRIVKHTMGETCVPLNPQRIVTLDILSLSNIIALGIKRYSQRVQELKQSLDVLYKSSQKQQGRSFYASFIFASDGLTFTQRDSFAGTILNDLGLLSPKSSNDIILPISEESFAEIDSDVLFVGTYQENGRSTLERIQRRPLWSKIKAVRKKQVYFVDFLPWYGFDFLSAHTVLDDIKKYLVSQPVTTQSNW